MDDERFEELLEQSSLGSPGARQLRARAPREQVALTRRISDLRNRMIHGDHVQARAAGVALLQLLREHGYQASADGEQSAVESQRLDERTRLQLSFDMLRQMASRGHFNIADLDFEKLSAMVTDIEPEVADDTRLPPPAGEGEENRAEDLNPADAITSEVVTLTKSASGDPGRRTDAPNDASSSASLPRARAQPLSAGDAPLVCQPWRIR